MKYKYVPAFVMLSAGAITCIISMIQHYDTLYSLKILLFVLLLFWGIGGLTRAALIRITGMEKKQGETEASGEADRGEDPVLETVEREFKS